MIKIYGIGNYHQPFKDQLSISYLQSKGITYTSNPFFADVLVGSSLLTRKGKLFKALFFFKKFMIYSNEPRHDFTFAHFEKKNEITMNVYSGNVFFNNLHFLGSYHYDFTNNLGVELNAPPLAYLTTETLKEKKKFCAAVFSCKIPALTNFNNHGVDISLDKKRQNLAQYFYSKGKADIIGAGWPEDIQVTEESGFDNGNSAWWTRKLEVLKDYKFNICYENTAFPHYCTEKIWHAIVAGSLPIYYGRGTAIYETFPDGSFIDASEFKSHEELLHYVENLSEDEHLKRYNKCLDVFNLSCKQKADNPDMKTEILNKFIENVSRLTKKA